MQSIRGNHYRNKANSYALLTATEEKELAVAWQKNGDQKAAEKIVCAHLKLVLKIASNFKGYGFPEDELVAEGNIGLLQALKNFDPSKGFRFSTYAMWWIKSNVQEYVMHNWSMIKIGTTSTQKKLFFKLRQMQQKMAFSSPDDNNDKQFFYDSVAEKLDIASNEVEEMHVRLSARDNSLNAPIGSSDSDSCEAQDFLKDRAESIEETLCEQDELKKRHSVFTKVFSTLSEREQQIIVSRRLSEDPLTLEEVSVKLGLSRERVRQIENSTFEKIRKKIQISLPTSN